MLPSYTRTTLLLLESYVIEVRVTVLVVNETAVPKLILVPLTVPTIASLPPLLAVTTFPLVESNVADM